MIWIMWIFLQAAAGARFQPFHLCVDFSVNKTENSNKPLGNIYSHLHKAWQSSSILDQFQIWGLRIISLNSPPMFWKISCDVKIATVRLYECNLLNLDDIHCETQRCWSSSTKGMNLHFQQFNAWQLHDWWMWLKFSHLCKYMIFITGIGWVHGTE